MKSNRAASFVTIAFLLGIPSVLIATMAPVTDDFPSRQTERLKKAIEGHLGFPYGLGHSGPKRFDCSGFVWRVLNETGIHMNRTSARKLFFLLLRVSDEDRWVFGTMVFFNRQRHCGLVKDSSSFYHASRKRGTTLSSLDPYWRSRISGFGKVPQASAVCVNTSASRGSPEGKEPIGG